MKRVVRCGRTTISSQIKDFINEESVALAALPGTDDNYEKLITDVFPFDAPTLDRLFDAEADKFAQVPGAEATELYQARGLAFTPEIMRLVGAIFDFQILDDLWIQHLEAWITCVKVFTGQVLVSETTCRISPPGASYVRIYAGYAPS